MPLGRLRAVAETEGRVSGGLSGKTLRERVTRISVAQLRTALSGSDSTGHEHGRNGGRGSGNQLPPVCGKGVFHIANLAIGALDHAG